MIIIYICLSPWVCAEEIRFSVGEKKHFYFPKLKKFENFNPKLIQAKINPQKQEVTLTALSKGNGKVLLHDHNGKRTLPVIVYSKLALDYEREITELTKEIEGIAVRNVGHKVMITGKILTPYDQNLLKRLEKIYDNIINLTTALPSAKVIKLKKMIHMNVKLMELNTSDLKAMGLELSDVIKTQLSIQASSFQYSSQLELILKALQKKGWAKILANPKLVCKNGESATFLAGGEVPIRIATEKRMSVQWKSYGISLKINPTADTENNISTSLEVEISDLDSSHTVEGLPALITRRLSTHVNVTDGETIILSGLTHEKNSQQQQRLPFISKIPILGTLFSSQTHEHKKTELIIFVTPSIHTNKEDHSDA